MTKKIRLLLILALFLVAVLILILSQRSKRYNEFALRVDESIKEFTKDDVPRLIQVLDDDDQPESRRVRAAKALGVIGPDASSASSVLVANVGGLGFGSNWAAAKALIEIGPAAIPSMTDGLGGSKDSGRLVWALGRMGPQAAEAVPNLCEAFVDPYFPGRSRICWALGQIRANAEISVPTLIAALKDPKSSVRRDAVISLRHFADESNDVLSSIISAVDDEDRDVRDAAIVSLDMLSSDAADENVRKQAKEVFEKVVDKLRNR